MLQRGLVVASSDFWGVQRGYTVRLTHELGVYLSVPKDFYGGRQYCYRAAISQLANPLITR
jgi:hypothetical protein